jgi:hypothetical protein
VESGWPTLAARLGFRLSHRDGYDCPRRLVDLLMYEACGA